MAPIAGRRLFGPAHCIDALRHAERELGGAPSVRDYEEIAAKSKGALPAPTIWLLGQALRAAR